MSEGPTVTVARRVATALLALAVGLAGRALGADALPELSTSPRPTIILISLDACRADHLGSYGDDHATSPFLDRLAAEGVRFAHAFVNTHGTPPSHTTMLTSLYAETHGVGASAIAGKVDRVPADALMVQEILRGSGYLTLAVTGGGHVSKAQAFWRGFVAFDDRPGRIAEQAQRLLTLLDRYAEVRQPRFIFFHTYEIHSPYEGAPGAEPPASAAHSSFVPSSENLLRYVDRASELTADDLAHIESLYDADIRYTDEVLAGLFAELAQRGLLEHALVVVTADHGEELGEHGGLLHRGHLYDELLHVPLILWGSAVPQAGVSTRLVSTVDVAPTLLAAAGLPVPAVMAGHDLLAPPPNLNGEEAAVFAQYARERYAIRTQQWKLITTAQSGQVELYDLARDPGEQHDVAAAHAEQVAALRRRLEAWRAGLEGKPGRPEQATLSAAEKAQLEALGYVVGD